MKATAVILLLIFCGIASANVFEDVKWQRQNCDLVSVPDSVFSGCNRASQQEVCSDRCGGALCRYWNDRGEGRCSVLFGEGCVQLVNSRPSGCGALALVTIKGVLVAMLLLAAFFIL